MLLAKSLRWRGIAGPRVGLGGLAKRQLDMGLSVVFGADNITDETPDENPNAAAGGGNQYSQWSPGGFNGRFAYMRLIYDF